ncbi:MAG: hypothetical protein WAZ14_03045 [Patescibacteria group bacterium]
MPKKRWTIWSLTKSISMALGLVLVWRGAWYLLDAIDIWIFGGTHIWSAVIGVVIGLSVFYVFDKDLR